MPTIKVFNWPCEMGFRRADIGYTHNSMAGTAYTTGQPVAVTLATPRRMMIDASGFQKENGVVEVIRYSLQPNNFVRMPNPAWAKGRSKAVAALAGNVVWADGAEWASGATWGPYIGLNGARGVGSTSIDLLGLPPNEKVFKPGDMIGIGSGHYMIRAAASSNGGGQATVTLVRGLTEIAASQSQIEFPVRHLFQISLGIATDRDLAQVYDWSATFTEVFKSQYPGVTFEEASFFD